MQGSMLAVVAVALVLVFLLIWMNVLMVRRGRANAKKVQNRKPGSEAEAFAPPIDQGSVPDAQLAVSTNTALPPTPVPANAVTDETTEVSSRRRDRREAASEVLDSNVYEKVHAEAKTWSADDADEVRTQQGTGEMPKGTVATKEAGVDASARDVEVVPSEIRKRQSQGKKVFDRNRLPYFLHGASVPEFDSSEWHEVFVRLSEDANVMGWVAFHNDTAGASDREYEYGFLEVLRNYKKSVSNLQREVGLSHVVETSVVGDEGKIWFLTGNQDNWFALFVDRKADVHEIAKPFIGRLLSGE